MIHTQPITIILIRIIPPQQEPIDLGSSLWVFVEIGEEMVEGHLGVGVGWGVLGLVGEGFGLGDVTDVLD